MDQNAKPMGADEPRPFDSAVARFFQGLHPGATLDPRDAETVNRQLVRMLRRSYRLSDSEGQDVAQDVIVKLLEAARKRDGGLGNIENPGAYLMSLARNRAIDGLRRRYRGDLELSSELHALQSRDDEIAALLDKSADAALVGAAMKMARDAHDELVRRVVSTWLDLADELGGSPSNREVAKRAGVSHTSVNNALKRFKSYLREAPIRKP